MAREAMSGVDAAWLQMDRPENTADVVAVLRLAGTLSGARFRALVGRWVAAHPRFRQRVVRGALGRPAWEDEPRFRVAGHVVEARLGREPGALDAYASGVASARLDLRRAPWRLHLVHLPGATAIVAKLHHCIADGFALVAALLAISDSPAPAHRRPHRPRAFRDLAHLSSPREALRAALRDPRRAAELAGAGAWMSAALARLVALPADPATALHRALGGERRVACSRPLPLRPIRAAARARGATVNELLAAAAAGALRAWLLEAGQGPPARDVRALVPVNLRPVGAVQGLGNEFGLVFLDVPVSAATLDARIEALRARMKALKASADALVTRGVLWALGNLPAALERRINAFFTTKASFVLTSVPGPRRRVRLAGRRVERMMFWVPHPASLGLGVSILTYAGEVVVGVRADTAVVPDPGHLVRLLEEELRALAPQAGTRARDRRSPQPGAAAATAERATVERAEGKPGGHASGAVIPPDAPAAGSVAASP